jgi:hypothetical protein
VLTTPSRENLPVMNYSQWDCFAFMRCFLWRYNNPEANYSTIRISGGGGGGFPEGVSRSFKKRKRDILLGTWNVRSLYKVDFQEIGGGRGDWMELAQDKDRWRARVSTVKNLRVP